MMLTNECITGIDYEATTSAIVLAGLFVSFLIEYIVTRSLRWQANKKVESDEHSISAQAIAHAELANISIMDAGIIFHSIRTFPPP